MTTLYESMAKTIVANLLDVIKNNNLTISKELHDKIDAWTLMSDDENESSFEDEPEKYDLVGIDGNTFVICGYVRNAMKREHYSPDEIKAFTDKATSGDYENLIRVCYNQIEECNLRAKNNEEDACS